MDSLRSEKNARPLRADRIFAIAGAETRQTRYDRRENDSETTVDRFAVTRNRRYDDRRYEESPLRRIAVTKNRRYEESPS